MPEVRSRIRGLRLSRLAGPWRGARRASIAALLSLAAIAALPRLGEGASAGPQAAMTGAPAIGSEAAEGLCISCHTSFPLNPDQAGTLQVEGVPDHYQPGQTYKLTVRISHADKAALRWGFQMTAVSMKDGAGAGEFVVSDTATTQVLSSMSGTRSYVEHNYGGTAIGQSGGASWSFEWKAPAASAGRVGFFAAANVANADGSNQGDRVYSRSPLPIAETDAAGG